MGTVGEGPHAPHAAALGKTLLFMQKLWALTHAIQTMSKVMESTIGVTGPQRFALRIVGRAPGISAGALADALRIHPSTLTGVLRRLEARGLLSRKSARDDGRRLVLDLTETGRALNAQQTGTVEAAVRRALTRLSEEDAAAAERVFQTLLDELEREARQAGTDTLTPES